MFSKRFFPRVVKSQDCARKSKRETFWKHEKRRKCWYPAFSLFPTMLSTFPKTNLNISVIFILSSANAFKIVPVQKICRLVASSLKPNWICCLCFENRWILKFVVGQRVKERTLTLRLLSTTEGLFADSVDQNQTAQNILSDLLSTLSYKNIQYNLYS